jgi:hypothetical protein
MTEAANYTHYQKEITKIIKYLERDTGDVEVLNKVQAKLDKLAAQYEHDESLGNARYKLYQAQAMLSYRLGDSLKARQFIEEAVNVRGQNYKLADDLLSHLKSEKPLKSTATNKPKNTKTIAWSVAVALLLVVGVAWSVHSSNSVNHPWWNGEQNVYTVSTSPVADVPPEVVAMSSSRVLAVSNGSQITEVILAGVAQKTEDTKCTVVSGVHECSFAFTNQPLGDIWTVASSPGASQ